MALTRTDRPKLKLKGDEPMPHKNSNFKKPDPEIAKRALEEARSRKEAIDKVTKSAPKEINGKKGPDPARYGDWENKGIASDF